MGLENIFTLISKASFFCPSVLHFVEARGHNKNRPFEKAVRLGSGRLGAMWREEVAEGLGTVCGRTGRRGQEKGSRYMDTTGHDWTRLDTTEHDRTRPDTAGHDQT